MRGFVAVARHIKREEGNINLGFGNLTGHPDFLDLPWEQSLIAWQHHRLVELPKGISRHTVRFVQYPEGVYAVKELPRRPARQDYGVLRALEPKGTPSAVAVGLVENRTEDNSAEESAALITAYEQYSFSYREILAGPGFGPNRQKMLDAFAGLLVELHLAGCFWGDCSLSNVLYRWDAAAIETIMVDAETASIHEELSEGQRMEDIEIMTINVAGGMADIAALTGTEVDDADLALGEDIAERYESLWTELMRTETIPIDEQFRITERIRRLNALGFDIDEMQLTESSDGGDLRFKIAVAGRNYHRDRLLQLTGIDAGDFQARHLLSDLYYYQATSGNNTASGKAVEAIKWRVSQFEPTIVAISAVDPSLDPVQGYCDLLNHRYLKSAEAGHDVGNATAFESWVAEGLPGFPLPGFPLTEA